MGSVAQRQLSLAASILFSFFLTFKIIQALSILGNTIAPERYLIRIAICLFGFLFPIIGAWFSFKFLGSLFFIVYASIMIFFVGHVTASPVFVWFLMEYAGLCYLLFRMDQHFEDQMAGISVDREKYQNEKNDLEVAHKAKGEGISILFEKYSTYYNLRKFAEELVTSLSVTPLAQIIVNRTMDFIARGNLAILGLVDPGAQHLEVMAYRQVGKSSLQEVGRHLREDLFDQWVIKNQRRLIVMDAHQDFRFDIKEAARLEELRSLIMVPLLNERRVIGSLRINSVHPETFSNDDLRLLDTIAVLASSALSNAALYEKTEQLAIRDSLTDLYVRRYFFDRLKEEHRRALMTHRNLSLLMCDLDHFKDCNDRHGHAVGDLMLTQFAQILKQNAENAIIARYGGEEFSILLPERSKEEAFQFGEKIRSLVEKNPFVIRREKIEMTVSIGVSNLPADALDLESLVVKADQALYRAKREGRNRVCSSEA